MQQIFLGLGAGAKKTYIDDVFSTFLYTGNASDKTITNGIDLAGEGGLTWIKRRNGSSDHALVDTVRSASEYLSSNSDAVPVATGANNNFNSFTSTGFTLKDDNGNDFFNKNNTPYSSWSFRKAPGFFDVVKYQGDSSSTKSIAHNLGCVPGMIIVKNLDTTKDWAVYHRDYSPNNSGNDALKLNETGAGIGSQARFGNTLPTATHFTVGPNNSCNKNGDEFIAYLFAGGESTAATARSVSFDSNGEYLSIGDSNDFDLGSTFTFEAWVKPDFQSDDYYQFFYEHGSFNISISKNGNFIFDSNHIHVGGDRMSSAGSVPEGQWTHVAAVSSSGVLKLYVNGVHDQNSSQTGLNITGDSGDVEIGRPNNSGRFTGNISNLRIVKGTAVYTSSFRPPTEPLTNITNTVLLCCNNSSVTGSTVTPNTITANGSPTASSDSPFDDPAGFVFGDAGDQNIIKCGSYVGTGQNAGWQADNTVELGFVPQWVMVKRTDGGDWVMVDQMRSNNPFRKRLHANESVSETGSLAVAPSGDIRNYDNGLGFNVRGTDSDVNDDGSTYIYIAIREAAGIMKRPPSLGTEVFAVDSGNSSSTIPAFDSAFTVDFLLNTIPGSSNQENLMYMRKGVTDFIRLHDTANGSSNSNAVWDSNLGWGKNFSSSFYSWMWASYSGAVGRSHYGTGATHDIPHNLGQTPEMMWVRKQGGSGTESSAVYHKALASNVDLQLNQSYTSPTTDTTTFNQTAPTSTHFTVGTSNRTNGDGNTYFVMLFASVNGISKVGSYDGSDSDLTVTVGFQPRFLMVKQYAVTSGSVSGNWVIVDTIRGWGSGNDKIRHLNSTSFISDADVGTPTSTGFTLTGNNNDWNQSGKSYIYYAHA